MIQTTSKTGKFQTGDLVRYTQSESSPDEETVFLVLDRRRGIVIESEMVCVLLNPHTLAMFPVYEHELELVQTHFIN